MKTVYVVVARQNKASEPYLVGVFASENAAQAAADDPSNEGWTTSVLPTVLNWRRVLPDLEAKEDA